MILTNRGRWFAGIGLVIFASIAPTPPADASTMVCEQTVYAPTIVEMGQRDQIVYGVKWACSIRPTMMFVEAQAKKRNVASGVYEDYGAPQTYQCGYGGYGSCKATYTIFDWTYCVTTGHYRTQGTTEAFWQTWGGTGPVSVPSQGGKWIDCTGHGRATYHDPQTAAEQAQNAAVVAEYLTSTR